MNRYSKLEIKVAESLLKNGYRWIARDEDGTLYAFKIEPYKDETVWTDEASSYLRVHSCTNQIFQDIKWCDYEPTYIADIVYSSILDSTERRHLEAVLRPLPEVAFVKKVHDSSLGIDQILVAFANDYFMCFPPMKEGTMYKGMKTLKEYKPEELGLNLEGKHETD